MHTRAPTQIPEDENIPNEFAGGDPRCHSASILGPPAVEWSCTCLVDLCQPGGSNTEVLVFALALLVQESVGGIEENDVLMWTKSVNLASAAYKPGEPWSAPDSWRREEQHIPKMLADAIRARSSAAIYTLGHSFFDLAVSYGDGVAFMLTYGMIEGYFEKVLSGKLRGLGHDARAGRGPLLHVYLAPRVASLLVQHGAALRAVVERTYEQFLEEHKPGERGGSAQKPVVKAMLALAQEENQMYQAELHDYEKVVRRQAREQQRRADAARRRETATKQRLQRKADAEVDRRTAAARDTAHKDVAHELKELRARVKYLEKQVAEDEEELKAANADNAQLRARVRTLEDRAARYGISATRRAERARADARELATKLEKELADSNSARDALLADKEKLEQQVCVMKKQSADKAIRVLCADGPGGTWPDDVRLLYMKLLVLGCAPSNLAEVVVSCIVACVPWAIDAGLELPDVGFARTLRGELGQLAKSESAIAIAGSRVVGAGVDATPINTAEYGTFNGRLENGRHLIMGGAFRFPGQTALIEAGSVATMFDRLSEDFEMIRAEVTRLHGADACAALLPTSGSVGLHKCGDGCVITTDNATAALAGRREISRLVANAVETSFGSAWAAMDDEARAAATLSYGANCFRHLPNTWLAGGEKFESAWLKTAMEASIAELAMSDEEKRKARITPGCAGLVRAIAKEFGTGEGVYAKGEGEKVFTPWVKTNYPQSLVVRIERAEKGSRFDIATRAAWAISYNRPILMDFLSTVTLADTNILKDYLLTMLGCLENVACINARAIVNDKFTEPMLFLAASKELDGWSVLDMAPICDMVVSALERGAADGTVWMTDDFKVFDAVTHPAFIEHETKRTLAEVRAADNKTTCKITQLVRAELYNPVETVNKDARALVAHAVTVWCKGMLKTLTEGEGAKYVAGGEYGIDKQTEAMKKHFTNTYRNTDEPCESYFGLVKYIKTRFTNLSVAHADAMAHALRNQLFSVLAPLVTKRRGPRSAHSANASKRAKKMTVARRGRLELLDERLRSVMMTAARRGLATAKKRAAADDAAAHEHALARRDEAIKKRLEQQVAQYVRAKAAFAIEPLDPVRLDAALSTCRTTAAQTALLRNQIRRLVDGCGLSRFKMKLTSTVDTNIGREGTDENREYLRRSLLAMYSTIAAENITLPTEPAVPQLKRRVVPRVGTVTAERLALDMKQMQSDDEIKTKAVELAAQAKSRAAPRLAQPAPVVDSSLVGRSVSVIFEMTYKEKGKRAVSGLFGCPGKITRVSDETTKIKKKKIGLGWAFIEYTDESEDWQLLRPTFYRANRAGGWRLIDEDEADLDAEYELEDGSDDGSSDGSDDDDDDDSGSSSEDGE